MDEECVNPECTHDEPNDVGRCVYCRAEMIYRSPEGLPPGSVVAYDPFCGTTLVTR